MLTIDLIGPTLANSNIKQMQDNMMAINTTLSSFLNIKHTREIKDRKDNILYINPSFSSLYFHIIQNP
jgi:hypothetical protein